MADLLLIVRAFRGPFLLALLVLLVLLAACGSSQGRAAGAPAEDPRSAPGDNASPTNGPSQERFPPRGEAWVIFGTDTVSVEVARTPEEREKGLMYREALAGGRGMLFVFPNAQMRSFWMRNTFIALDIAYMDESLTIVDIQSMEPQSEDFHESARPAMFALEVPLGWFGEKGIAVGAVARVIFGPG